ncbi:DUF4229 domain-containing protein [Sediminihabitans luteus]|uniref:DUF4229 domain-containing protein n=1 Tax=Sediminihabitans luteus TaxID=1138585 RepID=UPI001EF2C3C1|nr:DUF4229 domain-containing protein [Sediminihabitans luteus]
MPLVTYTVLRLLLFAAALGGLYLAGVRDWLLVLLAAVVALLLSYLLLAKPRDAAATYLATRGERRRELKADGKGSRFQRGLADDDAAEDAADDAQRSAG